MKCLEIITLKPQTTLGADEDSEAAHKAEILKTASAVPPAATLVGEERDSACNSEMSDVTRV